MSSGVGLSSMAPASSRSEATPSEEMALCCWREDGGVNFNPNLPMQGEPVSGGRTGCTTR